MLTSNERLKYALLLTAVTGITTSVGLFIYYLYEFGPTISTKHSDWAEFGDYFGGTVGAIFGLFSFIALLYTIYIQTTELRRSSDSQEKSTNYSRLNALIALREHYLKAMLHQAEVAKIMNRMEGSSLSIQKYGEFDKLAREVGAEIEKYHEHLLKSFNKI